jgi:outer membrane protein OmpA-like peptidoglycan-associated protein
MQILCIGHTCDKGNDKTNFATGQNRAQEIKDYLIQQGISPERIKTKNMGDTEPLVPNTNEANRRKNRRVEIKITS